MAISKAYLQKTFKAGIDKKVGSMVKKGYRKSKKKSKNRSLDIANKLQAEKESREQAKKTQTSIIDKTKASKINYDSGLIEGEKPQLTTMGPSLPPSNIEEGEGGIKIDFGAQQTGGLSQQGYDAAKEAGLVVSEHDLMAIGLTGTTGVGTTVANTKVAALIGNMLSKVKATWVIGTYLMTAFLDEESIQPVQFAASKAYDNLVFNPGPESQAIYDQAITDLDDALDQEQIDKIMNLIPGVNIANTVYKKYWGNSRKSLETYKGMGEIQKKKAADIESGMTEAEAEMQAYNDNRDKQREIDLQIQLEKEKRYEDSRAEQEALDVAREERYDRREARSKADDAEERAYWEEVRAAELIKLEEERAYWAAVWEQKVKFNSESSRSSLSFGLFR